MDRRRRRAGGRDRRAGGAARRGRRAGGAARRAGQPGRRRAGRRQPGVRARAEAGDRAGARDIDGADHRRDRHRQGGDRPPHPPRQRPRAPFVAVNCGAHPRALLESELFGHERGAFTGARHARARGASRPPTAARCSSTRSASCARALQVKLLRVLQEREFVPRRRRRAALGRRPRRRRHAPRSGGRDRGRAFREDLYYRLNVVASRSRRCASGARTSRRWRHVLLPVWRRAWDAPIRA